MFVSINAISFAVLLPSGDIEKLEGLTPDEMMDRTKAFVPRIQYKFLEDVVIPIFELLARIFSTEHGALQSLSMARLNAKFWRRFEKIYLEVHGTEEGSLWTVYNDDKFWTDVIDAMKDEWPVFLPE